jgi:hypothetical protein
LGQSVSPGVASFDPGAADNRTPRRHARGILDADRVDWSGGRSSRLRRSCVGPPVRLLVRAGFAANPQLLRNGRRGLRLDGTFKCLGLGWCRFDGSSRAERLFSGHFGASGEAVIHCYWLFLLGNAITPIAGDVA